MDSKAEYSALSSTRSQKKKLKRTVQVKIREGRPEGIRVTDYMRKGFVKEMSFKSGVKGRGSDRW